MIITPTIDNANSFSKKKKKKKKTKEKNGRKEGKNRDISAVQIT